jgi:hypothetical protein
VDVSYQNRTQEDVECRDRQAMRRDVEIADAGAIGERDRDRRLSPSGLSRRRKLDSRCSTVRNSFALSCSIESARRSLNFTQHPLDARKCAKAH